MFFCMSLLGSSFCIISCYINLYLLMWGWSWSWEYIGVYIGPLRPCQVCLITSHYIYIYIYIHTHILVHLAIYCTSCFQRVHHDDVTNRYQNYLKCAQLYNRVSFQISLKINSSNFNFIYIYIYI